MKPSPAAHPALAQPQPPRPLMLGVSMFEKGVPGEVLRLEYARFPSAGGDHSRILGKAVTGALALRPPRAVVRAPSQMAIHLAPVNAIRGSSGHHFRQSPADRVSLSSRIQPLHGRKWTIASMWANGYLQVRRGSLDCDDRSSRVMDTGCGS